MADAGRSVATPREDLRSIVAAALRDVLADASFLKLPGFSRGKVRDSYDLGDGRRILITTDRQSAFDHVLAAVPFKGQVLTGVARFWFDATRDIIANHVIDYPDPNVMVVHRLEMLPIEVVVRDYLTGSTMTSIWPMYARGERRMYGLMLPDGLRKNDKLPETVLTPTTKAAAVGHDQPISPQDIVSSGLLSEADWQTVLAAALALFARGRDIAARRGLILVDTKYEFGRDATGQIVLADEIHTPDSSRYWRADSYAARCTAREDPDSLDKDFLRRWITARCDPYTEQIPQIPDETLIDFSLLYIALYETITGNPFYPAELGQSIHARVAAAVQSYLGDGWRTVQQGRPESGEGSA